MLVTRYASSLIPLSLLLSCGAPQQATPKPDAASPRIPTLDEAAAQVAGDISSNVDPQRKVVAVFPLEERGSGETVLGEYVSDKLIVALAKTGQFQVVERSRLETLMKEIDLSGKGLTSEETALSIGNMAGANSVVVGVLTRVNASVWEISTRRLGSENAAVLGVSERKFSTSSIPTGIAGRTLDSGLPTSGGTPERKWPGISDCGDKRACYQQNGLQGIWRCTHRLYTFGITVGEDGTVKLATSRNQRAEGCMKCDGSAELKGSNFYVTGAKLDVKAKTYVWGWCMGETLENCRAMGGNRETSTCRKL